MQLLRAFLSNHVLANIAFVVVIILGVLAYLALPRAQDPEVNFNWISIITAFPGASAADVEKLVTDPLEEAIENVPDIRFVSSTSREGLSDILVRFDDIGTRAFERRLNDLRREVQNKSSQELPVAAEDPLIREITTSNAFPIATVVVVGQSNDEMLRREARIARQDIQRLRGVDTVDAAGLNDPELQVFFDPLRLQQYGVTATALADTISAYFRDTSAGNLSLSERQWLVRVLGTDAEPTYIAQLPVLTAYGEVPIASLADVQRGRSDARQMVSYQQRPAVTLGISKTADANTLDLVARIGEYIEDRNDLLAPMGVQLVLLDDQTASTRDAINVMQTNALLGLLFVFAVAFVFLGGRIAFFVGIGIPFVLAGTFLVLSVSGQTLNQSVLLGVVIALGMLVDDAVVVVESVYYRLQRGMETMQAVLEALREVFAPVTTSVLTTIAAFLPLMLMPGIVGEFMFVIPFVVTVALVVSLFQAYWMLPVHISAAGVQFDRPSRTQALRVRGTHWLRVKYSQALVKVLRRPWLSLAAVVLLFVLTIGAFAAGLVRVQFFTFDPLRLFYVNVEMEPGASLEDTLRHVELIESKVLSGVEDHELRGSSAMAGMMFTETAPFFGDNYGQVMVSLQPRGRNGRDADDIVEQVRADVMSTAGPKNIAFLTLSGGPPTSKPINIKVRGNDFDELRAAADALKEVLAAMPGVTDIIDDDSSGKDELRFRFDSDAVRRAQINPADLARTMRLLVDGEVVSSMQHEGETLEVRVRALPTVTHDIDAMLRQPIVLADGGEVALGQLLSVETGLGRASIRHYNMRRVITVEADLDQRQMNTLAANRQVVNEWQEIRHRFPGVVLDFTGEMDDIQESLDAMLMLFLLGIGLIYLILGTLFKSYWQPFMILVTVPLAFIGVTLGLVVTQAPLSLFTMYGVIALGGIAVNSAIVMIDAANRRLQSGMTVLHAIVYAGRRRVVPILITSLTTIAGLFSLAVGLGGRSMLWGPVASAIVWGLAFSTVLTLFVIPLLYRIFMGRAVARRNKRDSVPAA
ncbi:cation transporter [Alkalilimnicola ehrlichii]|uniref:Cation transporter n=1 Tax=Alkalilimnicola ehrlichii TaxID=351052 RepID=A0A3E0WT46_9GAMM|nr:efflux RND transporter permease subunit [Alkalilimnicola ehrlichii]RFA29238.1 cation transporter [Alkalilimnicola ehrlichii]RFA36150.1 cation transporter [Alkalilimnicola ehrlichii]